MTNTNADSANDTGLLSDSLISTVTDKEVDLSTLEGRIEWYCAQFEVTPPEIEYDPDEPTEILLTDDLMRWVKFEGVNLDWLFCGSVSGVLAACRKEHRISKTERELLAVFQGFEETEKRMLLSGLARAVLPENDFDAVMSETMVGIRQRRSESLVVKS